MKVINGFRGPTLLDSVVYALQKHGGDRFDLGVGYAKNLTDKTFKKFGKALEAWLAVDNKRRFRFFIGDHRHPNDTPFQQAIKINECTAVAANLINFVSGSEEQIEIVFLHRLHAKFYSMWSASQPIDQLKWAIVGSSNLTDAALLEKNFELDIFFEPGDSQLKDIEPMFRSFITEAYKECDLFGTLHDMIDGLTAKVRWEHVKIKVAEEARAEAEAEAESESHADEVRRAEEQARLESDRSLGINGTD